MCIYMYVGIYECIYIIYDIYIKKLTLLERETLFLELGLYYLRLPCKYRIFSIRKERKKKKKKR